MAFLAPADATKGAQKVFFCQITMFYKYFSIFSQISSSADNANAAAQAGSATDNAPHHTASSGTGQAQNKNNNASSSISVSAENNSKINPSNHVGGGTDRPSSGTADRSQNGEIDYRKVNIVFKF